MRIQCLILVLLAVAGSPACSPAANGPDARIAVAANFRETALELERVFEAQSDYDIELVFGSTGQLYAQIVNGAPFDAFLAADEVRPGLLDEAGLGVDGSRFTYAIGLLALWSADPDMLRGDPLEVLQAGDFRKIAIANPDLAPYGAAAEDTLKALGLITALERKIVRGENVAQAFMLVDTGNADLRFVALSQVLETGQDGSYWTVPRELYQPIRQDALVLKRGETNIAALSFMEFMATTSGDKVIERHGYERAG